MNFFKKIKILLSFDSKAKWMLVEALFLLGWARFLKSLPFSIIVPSLGNEMQETDYVIDDSSKEIVRRVSGAVNLVSKYTIWESMCLVKAIAAMRMLEKRGIESTLYLGTAKDQSGKMIAHAWLRSGPYYITGAEGLGKFTVVKKYAKQLLNKSYKAIDENNA
jgi:hypothetical protein